MNVENSSLEAVYDQWYANAYMDDWPQWKKQRVASVIKSMQLPEKGVALDFGCGSGVFTRVLKEVLPGWDVYGSDLSEVAMSIAKERSVNVQYLKSHDCPHNFFDFVFTHHVLEHVDDIEAIASSVSAFAKIGASMLHILPCGNTGGLEYFIASSMHEGFNTNKGNTYFFEEELHLNRFQSAKLEDFFRVYQWQLKDSFFANHHLAVISWLGGMNTQYIKSVTDYKRAIKNKPALFCLRILLLTFYYLQRPYTYFKLKGLNRAWTGPLLRHPQIKQNREFGLTELCLFPSFFIVLFLDFLERMDWVLFRKDKQGGEMYLIFDRKY